MSAPGAAGPAGEGGAGPAGAAAPPPAAAAAPPGMQRFLDAANAISLAGLGLAVLVVVLSARGLVPWACAALVGCGLCDVFDGLVARRLRRDALGRTFGQRLDTVVDACAFGVAPVALLHAAGLRAPLEVALLVVFAACAAWRLAYFDTVGLQETDAGRRRYVGLPTTFASLALPVALLAGYHDAQAARVAGAVAASGLSAAMISPFRVPKPSGLAYPVLSGLALAVLGAHLALAPRWAGPGP